MSENTIEPRAESSVESLRNEVQTLRAILAFSVLLLFVFSVCVNIFLMHQTSALSRQVQQAQAAVSTFETAGGGAQVVDIWTKLNDYSRTHPDFQPIINKYTPFFTAHMTPKKK